MLEEPARDIRRRAEEGRLAEGKQAGVAQQQVQPEAEDGEDPDFRGDRRPDDERQEGDRQQDQDQRSFHRGAGKSNRAGYVWFPRCKSARLWPQDARPRAEGGNMPDKKVALGRRQFLKQSSAVLTGAAASAALAPGAQAQNLAGESWERGYGAGFTGF